MIGKPRKVYVRGEPRWMVDGREPGTGKRRREYFPTKAEADGRQAVINATPVDEAPLIPECDPDVTVGAFTESWLSDEQVGWKRRTVRSYTDTMRLHVHPFVVGPGSRTVADLPVREWPRGLVQRS